MTALDTAMGTPTGELERIASALIERFCPPLLPDTVRGCVVDCAARFDGAPVRDFLPILIEREAIARLKLAASRDERPS